MDNYDIARKKWIEEEIRPQLTDVVFPCYLVVYGVDEDYCTSHRRANYSSKFHADMCYDLESLISIIDRYSDSYEGSYGSMDIKVVYMGMVEDWGTSDDNGDSLMIPGLIEKVL